MKKIYKIFTLTFFCLLIGQLGYSQEFNGEFGDYQSFNTDLSNSQFGAWTITLDPIEAVEVYIKPQPITSPDYSIKPVDITIIVHYSPETGVEPISHDVSPIDETSDLYWYLYYSYENSSDSGSNDSGSGGGQGYIPTPDDDAPEWYLDNDYDGYHSKKMKSWSNPGSGWNLGQSSGLDCDDSNPDVYDICPNLKLEVSHSNGKRVARSGEKMYILNTSDNYLYLKATGTHHNDYLEWTNGLSNGTQEGSQSYYSNATIKVDAQMYTHTESAAVDVEIVPFRDNSSSNTPYTLNILKDKLKNFKPLGADLSITAEGTVAERDYNEISPDDRFINDIDEKSLSFSASGGAEVLIPGYSFTFPFAKGGVYIALKGSLAFTLTQKTSIKNDGFNNEVKDGTITFDGSACLESGVKFETTVDQSDFVDFSITGGATACIEGSGQNTKDGFAININAKPPAFIFAVKATMNGIDLINYNKKVGFSAPIPIVENYIMF